MFIKSILKTMPFSIFVIGEISKIPRGAPAEIPAS
jgi:hypothetical protein